MRQPGQRIVLRHAEVLADGELYTGNLRRAAATDTYLTGGATTEVFEPQFTLHGFRYAEIAGYPGQLAGADVTARVLHNDLPWTGRFECSDPVVNQLHANIGWGQRGNFVAVPTDCPQRDERLGWLADAQVFAPTAARNADVSAFFARWLRDVMDGQNADGAFRDVAPVIVLDREGAPAWGDGGVIIPWLLWRTYGDRRVLERCFDAMVAWVEHIHRHNPDLLWQHRTGNSYGDWLQVDAETPRCPGHRLLRPQHATRRRRRRGARRRRRAAQYRALHAAITTAFRDAYVGDDGSVKGGTQTAYLLALGFGLLPEALVGAAVGHLAADIESRGNRLTTGFVGVALLCPVLSDHGRADLAYALLHQDEYPSWALLDPARRHHHLGALGRLDHRTRLPVRRDELVQPLQPRQRRRLALRPGRRHRPDRGLRRLLRAAAAAHPGRAAHLGARRAGDGPRACRLWVVPRRRPAHRDRHGAAGMHRRTPDSPLPMSAACARTTCPRPKCPASSGSTGPPCG